MEIYLVGGAVRDLLMGLEPKDKDYVVVGSSPEEMVALGFHQVGKDFPVFLHPVTGDEYALARTERKVGVGHTGFETDWKGVTLQQDLLRRDLTINAIALNVMTGQYHDPYDGRYDIGQKILRPVSESFKEDPIRVLRAARFMARYPDFDHASSLVQYSKAVAGEISQCSPERVWVEIAKAMGEKKPSNFFKWLRQFGIFPMLDEMAETPQKLEHHPENWVDVHTYLAMDYAAETFKDAEVVFAVFCHDFGKPECHREYGNAFGHDAAGVKHIEAFCEQWKVPSAYRGLAVMTAKLHTKVHGCMGRNTNDWMRPRSIMQMFNETNALNRPLRFVKMLQACMADARGRGATPAEVAEFKNKPYKQFDYLYECLYAVMEMDTKPITLPLVAKGVHGRQIGEQVHQARINVLKQVQNKWRNAR